MPLTKLEIPAGIKRDSTSYYTGPSWYDCNNIQFRGKAVESINGWYRDNLYELNGVGRASYSYRDYTGNLYQFVGTNWKQYVIVGADAYDITPTEAPINLTNPFTATNGSPFLLVNDVAHGRKVNDWVNFSSVASDVSTTFTAALLTQVRGFQITEIVDLDNYYIYIVDETTNTPVNSTAPASSGGAVVLDYRVTSGSIASAVGLGWGTGTYGGVPWGYASTLPVVIGEARRVYVTNYGEDLMFANSGGPLYYWDTSAKTVNGIPGASGTFQLSDKAVEMNSTNFPGASDVPTVVDSFLVSTRDGSCVGFGCNDIGSATQNSLLVRWSDQNNPFDWTPTPVNTAGGQVLRSGSRIVGGVATKDEVVIFTDSSLYSMRFIGPPDVFSFSLISSNISLVSHYAAVDAASSVFFMGNDGFYVYSGGAVQPLECPVVSYVYDDINLDQAQKCFGAVNSRSSEIFWFYPGIAGANPGSYEPNKFVCFNYESLHWSFGTMDMSPLNLGGGLQQNVNNRTSWRDAVITEYPMASYLKDYNDEPGSDGAGRTYPEIQCTGVMMHDFGTTANGEEIDSFVESGDIDISSGDELSFYSKIIPDLMIFNASLQTSVDISVKGKYYPGQVTSSSEGSVTANFPAPAANGTPVVREYTVGSGSNADSYVRDMNIRGRARSAALRISSSNIGGQWRLGVIRVETRPDGAR